MSDLLDEPFIALPVETGPLRDSINAVADPRGSCAEAVTPDETFEAVASGHGVVLLAEGNTTVYARPGIVYRPVLDLRHCELAIA